MYRQGSHSPPPFFVCTNKCHRSPHEKKRGLEVSIRQSPSRLCIPAVILACTPSLAFRAASPRPETLNPPPPPPQPHHRNTSSAQQSRWRTRGCRGHSGRSPGREAAATPCRASPAIQRASERCGRVWPKSGGYTHEQAKPRDKSKSATPPCRPHHHNPLFLHVPRGSCS